MTGKTGQYHDVPTSSFPWSDPRLDSFTLESNAGKPEYGSINILSLIKDKTRFYQLVRKLKRNKAPGPDGIPNEILRNLSDDMLEAIHSLFVLMYMTATTPAYFKESQTILLYKKDDPLQLENYRPICLAITISKLWTALLANCIAEYADHFDILSYSQEGFRARHNTIRQLQLVQNILTDAKMTVQDLYVMFVDFSSAFNTIDHDKLLVIMKHLGFPDELIEVIRDLYTDAFTTIKVAGGETDLVKIDRGTLQGDSLSPLLFIIFMEPLLRWLQSGGRGYSFATLHGDKHEHTIGANGYADDLFSATHSSKDLACQGQKIDKFSQWGGLKINAKKSGASAILYGQAAEKGQSPLSEKVVETSRRQLEQVTLAGQNLPFHHPDKDPYRYLGVMLTLTLNWRVQVGTLLSKVNEKATKIVNSLCSPAQKVHYIQSSIRPYITYSFPLAIYSLQDINRFDTPS